MNLRPRERQRAFRAKSLPFSTPIPLPGLSTPFGFIIALIGARLSLGQKPWLPQRLLDTRLPPKLFAKVFGAARALLKGFEYFLRPRLLWALVLFFSGLSFAGDVARRLVGPGHGYLVTGLLGGLVSSTNVTFTFARASRCRGMPGSFS